MGKCIIPVWKRSFLENKRLLLSGRETNISNKYHETELAVFDILNQSKLTSFLK